MSAIINLPPIPPNTPVELQSLLKTLIDNIIRLQKKVDDHEKRLITGGL